MPDRILLPIAFLRVSGGGEKPQAGGNCGLCRSVCTVSLFCSNSHFPTSVWAFTETDGLLSVIRSIYAAGASQGGRNSDLQNKFSCRKQLQLLW